MSQGFDPDAIARDRALPPGLLGSLRQVAIVTPDLRRAIDGLRASGIGPWRIYTFDQGNLAGATYRGAPGDFAFRVALCDMPHFMWEVIAPLDGANIYTDFLDARGGEGGVHHLLFNCEGLTWAEKTAAFESAGYACIQSGTWHGKVRFAYYDTDADTGLVFEIVDIASDWVRPEPDEVIA